MTGGGGPFEPLIVGYLCNWCSYAGADLAGITRIQYPTNIRVVRVMCSGRVDPGLVVRTLLEGADGVLALGCHPGDCHYQTGNLEAREKFEALRLLLERTRAGAGRFDYDWVSASEGARFAEVVTGFTDAIRALGPSPLRAGGDGDADADDDAGVRREMRAVLREVSGFRLRWLVGRARRLVEGGDAYGEEVNAEDWEAVVEEAARREYLRALIVERALESPVTVEELAALTGEAAGEVLRHVQRLRQKGRLTYSGAEGRSPLYSATEVARG